MASRPENIRLIDAHGTLRLDTPSGRSLDLVADGDTVRLELPGWSDARSVLPGSIRARARSVRILADLLAMHGLTLILETAGQPALRLGHNTPPSWLARLLGLGATDLPVSTIRLLFRG